MIDLSIVIVSWNVADDLRECLQSVEAASAGLQGVEVIVVDNNSSDRTVTMLKAEFPSVRLIQNDFNAGFAGGNNQGFAIARGRLVLLLNPDTVVRPDALRECIREIDRRPDVGVLGCRILFPTGEVQYECARNFPSLGALIFEAMYLHMLFPNSRLFGCTNMTYWDHQESRYVPCIVGAFMLVRREAFENAGMFDPAVPMYLDDTDLCFRVLKAGWRIFYLASATIVHKGGRSEAQTGRIRDPVAAEARYVFFRKHYGAASAFAYRLVALWQALFRLAVAMVATVVTVVHANPAVSRASRIRRHVALLRWCLGWSAPS